MLRKTLQRETSHQGAVRLTGTVLVIDTDTEDLKTYSEIVRSLDHEVFPCSSYQEGLRHLVTRKVDLVVVDQGGPYFESRFVLEDLSALRMHIPTIVLARHHSNRCYVEALGLGADEYLEKPVSPSEMQRVVAALIPPRVLIATFHP
jgi:DNA-binding response OmpR family regulator